MRNREQQGVSKKNRIIREQYTNYYNNHAIKADMCYDSSLRLEQEG